MELPATTPRDPRWLTLDNGARVLARPVTSVTVYAARARADALIALLKEAGAAVTKAGGTVEGVADLGDETDEKGVWDVLFAISLAELTVTDWDGVTRAGKPLVFAPDLLAPLFADARTVDLFVSRQMARHNGAVSEGNG